MWASSAETRRPLPPLPKKSKPVRLGKSQPSPPTTTRPHPRKKSFPAPAKTSTGCATGSGTAPFRRHPCRAEHPHHRPVQLDPGRASSQGHGHGGRSVLTHAGDCWDNYQVDYLYPGGVRVSFASSSSATTTCSRRACGCSAPMVLRPFLRRPHGDCRRAALAWTESMNTRRRRQVRGQRRIRDNLAFADRTRKHLHRQHRQWTRA